MKIILVIFFIFLSTFVFSKEIVDLANRKVIIKEKVDRIVCLSPGTLRLISYVKATNLVVGVENMEHKVGRGRPYGIANPKMHALPVITQGGPSTINKIPDLEPIMKVRPDVIFVTLLDREKADLMQKKSGIPVVVLSYGAFASFDETVFTSLNLLGEILNKKKEAQELVSYIQDLQKNLKSIAKNSQTKPLVYIGALGFKGGYGIESTNSSYPAFEWLNADNVAKKIKATGQHFINKERLLELDPDYIFMDAGGKDIALQNIKKLSKFYNELKAFKTNRVYNLFPFNQYTTNIENAFVDAYAIGKIIYPKEFKSVDLNAKAQEIYFKFLGVNVYEEVLKVHGELREVF